jgi:spore germination cell wall hydrolase CwlJ-like protein
MIAISYATSAVALGKWLARAALFALTLTVLLFWTNPASPTTDVINTVAEATVMVKKAIRPVDLQCLAENIYFEAGNQPELGKVAVGVVTLNRTMDRRFPKSVCGVVKQSTEGDTGLRCQFSWVCDDKTLPSQTNKNWRESLRIARMLLEGGYDQYRAIFENALFFHAASLKTDWHKRHPRVVQIGDHIFYK